MTLHHWLAIKEGWTNLEEEMHWDKGWDKHWYGDSPFAGRRPIPTYSTLDSLFWVCRVQGWNLMVLQDEDGKCIVGVHTGSIFDDEKADTPVQAVRDALEKVKEAEEK